MADQTNPHPGKPSPVIAIQIPKRRADKSTIFGLLLAVSFVVVAIAMGGSLKAFVDWPSVMIVVMGTLAVTAVSFTGPEFFGTLKVMGKSIFKREINPSVIAKQMIDIAMLARGEGVLALQKIDRELRKDSFLHRGILMIGDGNTGEEITRIMGQEIDSLLARHQRAIGILRRASEVAPAMGLIGTLIGLVQMLSMLDDPNSIGPSMAVALITTFYGAMLGTIVFAPLAIKLEINSQAEALEKNLVLEGLSSIARQENPRRLEMVLNSSLPPAQRIKYFD